MNAYITYDVTARQDDVKAGMRSRGYSDNWRLNYQTWHLPNTSLWKAEVSGVDVPLADINAVIAEVNRKNPFGERVALKRCIVLEMKAISGIPGDNDRP